VAIDLAEIDRPLMPVDDDLDGAREIARDADRACEIIGGPHGQHAKGQSRLVQGGSRMVQRAVTAGENDKVDLSGMGTDDIGEVGRSILRQGHRSHAGAMQEVNRRAERLSALAGPPVRQDERAGFGQNRRSRVHPSHMWRLRRASTAIFRDKNTVVASRSCSY
jgi:hypothetical protein